MKKGILTVLLTATMLISVFSGCGASQTTESTTAKTSPQQAAKSTTEVVTESTEETVVVASAEAATLDVLRVGVQALPKSLDPGVGIGNAFLMLGKNIFDTVMVKDGFNGNEMTSNICEKWENINDTTFEFKLKEGITFHNGIELTAKDVEYTLERALFGDSSYFGATLTAILPGLKDVEVIDAYTFRIIVEDADPVLVDRLSSTMGFYIVPKDYVEMVGNEEFGLMPIGTGPYKVVEFTPNSLVLEYYEGFYGERPTAERIEYILYPELSTRLTALLNGEIDVAFGLSPESVETVESAGLKVNSTVVDSIHMLCYNSSIEPMDDPNLRKALNLAIDRESLAEYIWSGQAKVLNGYNFPSYGEYYVKDFPNYEYNPEKAKELLAQSDYHGETIYYDLQSGYYTLGNEVAEAIASMWQAIGINVEIRYTDVWEYDSFHVHNWSNGPRFADPAGGLWLLWGEGTRCESTYWQNEDTWAEYVENAKTLLTSYDQQERYDANVRMLELWEEECVGTALFQITEIAGVRPGIEFLRTGDFAVDFRAGHLNVVE